MKLLLLIVVIVILSGGVYYYYRLAKNLAKEFKEFMVITFEALKDKKLTVSEKEAILKEYADIMPIAKSIKTKFVSDTNEIISDLKDFYLKLKEKVKK